MTHLKYNKLSIKHGVYGEYKLACKKEDYGQGTGWRMDIEQAIDGAEKGQDINQAMRLWCNRAPIPASHLE